MFFATKADEDSAEQFSVAKEYFFYNCKNLKLTLQQQVNDSPRFSLTSKYVEHVKFPSLGTFAEFILSFTLSLCVYGP